MSRIHIVQFLARAATLSPSSVALTFEGRSQTWAELNRSTEELAGGMRDLGVDRGDRVAILALNSDRYVQMFFAVWRLSAAVVPLNTRWSTDEIIHGLRDSTPRVLVLDDAFAPLAPALIDAIGPIEIIHIGDGAQPEGAHRYADVRERGEPVPDLGGGGEDMAGIFYTGGTTGHPKGVMLAHTSIVATLLSSQGEPPPENASLLCVLPMFHMAGAQLAIVAAIATRPLILHPTFDPVAILECIERDRVAALSLVPAMWGMLVDHPRAVDADLSSLRRALYGASPMPEGTLRRVAARLPGVALTQGYGQTETAGVCTVLGPEDHDPDAPTAHRLRSAGKAILFCEVRVLDESGSQQPTGVVGEIVVRGAGTMLGYWNLPAETAATLRDEWIMTGDAGYLDEDGYLFIVDRTKDMIVSGGENVYSAETETALSSHPDVAACAVVGVPDDTWGERVHAIVVPRAGTEPDAQALIDHCRERIAGYKCPKSVSFRVEPLPLSAAGKVLKRALRAPFWAGRDRKVN
jgi:acyl-CoA synthetase (AMP-forming)/AMP-acid ligase II